MDERTPPDIDATTLRIIENRLGLPAGKAKPEARFVDDLQADSLDLMDVLLALESRFGIAIEDDEAAKLVTVADAAALVRTKHAAIGAAQPNGGTHA